MVLVIKAGKASDSKAETIEGSINPKQRNFIERVICDYVLISIIGRDKLLIGAVLFVYLKNIGLKSNN